MAHSSGPARSSLPNGHSDSPSKEPPFPTLLEDLSTLPPGSHCLALHASREELAEQAASFLAGAEDPDRTTFWVADDRLLAYARQKVRTRAPALEGRVLRLDGPQVVSEGELLRPAPEIVRFIRAHPEGVTAGAATITTYWSRESVPAHLEYEDWFQDAPRAGCRYLCPYDLRRIPVEMAAEVLPTLARKHTHLVLSKVHGPAPELLQLLLFTRGPRAPPALEGAQAWAIREGLLIRQGERLVLSLEGLHLLRSLIAFPSEDPSA